MADDELTSKITLDTTSAVRSASEFNDRLAALEKAFVSLSGEAKKTGKSVEESGEKVKGVKGIFEGLAKGLDDVAKHSRTAGIALEQVGLEAEAGAAKLTGLKELFEGLGSATPMLLGVGAAITVIFAAFEGGKEAVEKASEWQTNMARLGVIVKNQGGDWKKLSVEVKEWAEVQEKTTAFSRDEAVNALEELTRAGMKLGDAQKVVRVAEDAAAATGKSLSEVTELLMRTEEGRTRGLVELGIAVKGTAMHHLTFNNVLDIIEKRMGGSAADQLEQYTGQMKQLHNVMDSLQEEIGLTFLPILTSLAQKLVVFVEQATEGWHKLQEGGEEWIKSHKEIMKTFSDLLTVVSIPFKLFINDLVTGWKNLVAIVSGAFDVIEDIMEGKWDKMWDDVQKTLGDVFNNILDSTGNWGKEFVAIVVGVANEIGHIFQDLWKDIESKNVAGLLAVGASSGSRIGQAVQRAIADFKANLAKEAGKGNSEGPDKARIEFNPADTHIEGGDNPLLSSHASQKRKKHQHLNPHPYDAAAEQALKIIELEAAARKKNAESIRAEYESLELLLNSQKMSTKERERIIELVSKLKTEEQKLIDQQTKEAASARAKQAAEEKVMYEDFIKHLEAMQKAHQITYQQMAAALREYTDQNKDLTQEMYDHAGELEDQWTQKQIDEDKKRADELAKALDDFQKQYDEFYKGLEKRAQEWTDKTSGFIEDLFAHQGKGQKHINEFADAFKTMLKDIEKALLKSVLYSMFMGGQGGFNFGQNFSAMLMGGGTKTTSGNGMLGLFGMLLGGGGKDGSMNEHAPTSMLGQFLATTKGQTAGGKVSAAQAAQSGAMSSGIVGAMIGDSNASQVASSLPTDSLLSLLLGVNAPQVNTTGDGSATGGGNGTGSGGIALPGGGIGGGIGGAIGSINSIGSIGNSIGGIGSIFSGLSKFFGTQLPGASAGFGATIGSVGLGALGGYGVGSLIGNLFPGQNDAPVGGALGGAAGAALGPLIDSFVGIGTGGLGLILGPLLGSVLGSGLGGLFGSHTSPATSPDIYNTNQFGGIETDLTGKAGMFNGTYITPNSQFMSATGGQSGLSWVEETLAKYANPDGSPGPNTPSWLAQQWSTLVGLFGISKTGAGQVNYAKNIGQEWVTGASGVTANASNPTSYQNYGTALNAFYSDYITQGNLSAVNANTAPYYYPGNGPGAGQNNFSQTNPYTGGITINVIIPADAIMQAASQGTVQQIIQAPFTSLQSFSGVNVTV